MDIGNFQVDNLLNEEMPVLLGAKDYYDKKIFVAGKSPDGKSNLARSFRLVQPEDLKPQELDSKNRPLERLPFLRANLAMSKKT